ncbi:MAG: hypothetical protein KME28_03850 [Pelatocladus maniniholoensis HA4357-MV3]|jgi:WD40 repeat protein|uniref:Effector-associated domain-containing protein n=1 Tax=Pelatocladus maniniholoensis HA4357-MV3 TaxID=1117104 RepID=A0A9E3H4K3_9NOST|nr:hypothetical protein [Pelatocladus maniniholoensis HA4357-MV3]
MTHPEQIQETLHRVEIGKQTDEDIKFLRQQLLAGDRQIVSQLGKYNVNIGQGRDIHIGDRIYQQWDEQAIQALVKAIQKVTWRCVANLTENDYTQSIGIGIIDKLSKQLTDFSQQSVMRYGLKLAFSPNSQQEYFVSSGNQVIKRWQTNTWEMLREISVPFSITDTFDLWFTAVAISPNSQLIAACKAYQVNVWTLGTDNLIHTFGKTVFSNFFDVFGFDSVAFSPDSKILAANDNRDIKLWDIETGNVFSPDGKTLVSGGNDGKIVEWKITKKESQILPQQHSRGVTSIAISPDGETLISGGRDQTIKVWRR